MMVAMIRGCELMALHDIVVQKESVSMKMDTVVDTSVYNSESSNGC